jgi:hypothetical protein
MHALEQVIQERRLLGPSHESLTLKTKNCDHSKRQKLFRTRHVVQYVASFLAGGGLCGADGRAANRCGEGATGGCLFACNFSVKRSTVLTEAERRTRPDMRPH